MASKCRFPTTDVVVGDLIVLESGMRVPADARLVDTHNLLVDESMLTGESFAITKKYDAMVDEHAPYWRQGYNGIFRDNSTKGQGPCRCHCRRAIIPNLEKYQLMLPEAEETLSPLQVKMAKFSKVLSYAILAAVAAIFIIGFLRNEDPLNMFPYLCRPGSICYSRRLAGCRNNYIVHRCFANGQEESYCKNGLLQ